MYNKILIVVDGSESNNIAVDQGLCLAKSLKAGSVTAICVFDEGNYSTVIRDSSAEYRKIMAEESENALKYVKAKAAEMGVAVEAKTIMGRPAEVIIEESADYDLVICATLGKTGFARVLLGSVAENVVRLAKCPVLVCR